MNTTSALAAALCTVNLLATAWAQDDAGKSLPMTTEVTVAVNDSADPAVRLTARGVARYFRSVCPTTKASAITRSDYLTEARKNHLILIGRAGAGNGLLDETLAQLKLEGRSAGPEGYSLRVLPSPFATGRFVVLIEADDKLGLQYGCYDLVKRVLGVRYLSPYFEHVPRRDRLDFAPLDILEKPQVPRRGVYPWAYHYNNRGAGGFADIGDRFRERDADWFKRYADWLIKHRQNFYCWYDDLYNWDPISQKLPADVRRHNATRGLKLLLGVGWACNEGTPRGGKWDAGLCIDKDGQLISGPYYYHPCPAAATYWELARMTLDKIDFSYEQIIGVVIGYGENGRAGRGNCGCIHCSDIPGDEKFMRDLRFVREYLADKGHAEIPVGFLEAEWGGPGAPLVPKLIPQLPDNALLAFNPYRATYWNHFEHWYDAVRKANSGGKGITIYQAAEVNFLCCQDVPLFRPSGFVLKHQHFSTLPRQDVAGVFAGHNTSQYLNWVHHSVLFEWSWRFDPDRHWCESIRELMSDVFGAECGRLTTRAIDKLICLEYAEPYQPWSKRTEKLAIFDPWSYRSYAGFLAPNWDKWTDESLLAVLDQRWELYAQLIDLAASIQDDVAQARRAATDQQGLFDREVAHVLEYTAEYIRSHLRAAQANLAAMQARRLAAADPPDVDGAVARLQAAVALIDQARQSRKRYHDLLSNGRDDFARPPDFAYPPQEEDIAPRLAKWQQLIETEDAAAIAAYSHYGK